MNIQTTFIQLSLLVALISTSGCGGGGGGSDDGSPSAPLDPPPVTSSVYSADIVEFDVVRADSGEAVVVSDVPLEGIEITMPDG